MALDKRAREQMLAHCGEIHEDDGVDPREYFRTGRNHSKLDRKAKQLCRQVAETLDQILAGETGDDMLRDLRVAQVIPAPDASRLQVTVETSGSKAGFDRCELEARLARIAGFLRTAVAGTITRKKAPSLSFVVAATPAADSGSGKGGR
ncbi:hypothetical protein NG895_25455 [Aeoliella sp. ICT_H6.2]|uniref:Ribosome-binding factor A n=1 Tax=Aeoliella straminimaris TaxID=2954799 RepID=A0A9X2JIX5_9BACT|nr:hypothetical protein [Aeoliella straminimaris]MCO6047261.1 hypothetical protein [Aeoliella straminimaris]